MTYSADHAFVRQPDLVALAIRLLTSGVDELGTVIAAEDAVGDARRREELARVALATLGLRPAGETDAQSSVDRRSGLVRCASQPQR